MGSNYTVYRPTVYSTALKPKAVLKEIAERVGLQIVLKISESGLALNTRQSVKNLNMVLLKGYLN